MGLDIPVIKLLKHQLANLVLSTLAIFKLFAQRPGYLVLAIISGFIFYQIIFWFLNIGLAQYLFTNPYLTIADKLDLIWGSFAGLFRPPVSVTGLMLLTVSLLQGIAIAGLTYTIRSNLQDKLQQRGAIGSLGVAGFLSVIGLGCAACGTSLIMPIISLFTATTSASLADEIGFYSIMFALLLTLVSLVVIGKRVYVNQSVSQASRFNS